MTMRDKELVRRTRAPLISSLFQPCGRIPEHVEAVKQLCGQVEGVNNDS